MKHLILILIGLFAFMKAYPTSQIPDKIIYNGNEYKLHCNPMEAYFELHPEKRPVNEIMSSNLWRGYVATFEIKDNALYLKDLSIQVSDTTTKDKFDHMWISVVDKVFPNETNIKIDWYTGLLVLPYGELLNYVHMGYGSTYENYILIEINKGNFMKEKDMNYEEYENFKDKQFKAFKKTDEYKKIKSEIQKEGDTDEFIDSFLRNYIIDYTTKILAD